MKVAESVPLRTVAEVFAEDNEKGTAPVPESETTCGLPEALSVIVTAPRRTSVVVGVKVTVRVQLAPAASVEGDTGQSLDWAKSPLATMFEMVKAAPPLLVSVTV